MVADATRQDGNNLAITRQLRGEEDHRDEDEQRTEHIHEVRDEIQIVVENNLAHSHLVLEEVIKLLREVENNGNTHDEHDRENERAKELAYYVSVQTFHLF